MINKNNSELILIFISIITFLSWMAPWYISIGIVFLMIIYLCYVKAEYKYYLYLLIFSIPSTNLVIGLNTYILTVILFIGVIFAIIKNKYVNLGQLSLMILLSFIYIVITLFFGNDIFRTIEGFGSIIQGFMGYYIITNSNIKVDKTFILEFSKVCAFWLLVVSLQLFKFYFDGDILQIISLKKIKLGWGISNYVAAFYSLLLPISLYPIIIEKKKALKYSYLIMFIINIIGSLLTISRGAYIGIGISFGILIIFYLKHTYKYIIYFAIINLMLIGIYYTGIFDSIIELIMSQRRFLEFLDDSGRYMLWNPGIIEILNKPLFGHGVGGNMDYILNNIPNAARWFHNFYIDIIFNFGLFGLIALIYFFNKCGLIFSNLKDSFIVFVAASLVGALAHQFVDMLFASWQHGLVMFIIIGIVELYRHNDKKDHMKLTYLKVGK